MRAADISNVTPDLDRARHSLDGLSVGDAFGNRVTWWLDHHPARLPPGPWTWTDDTHMALSILEILETFGRINQDALAAAFVRRFTEEPHRGYGGAVTLLMQMQHGESWQTAAPALFDGGSYGNGAAMRAAPIGACFWTDPAVAAAEAERSAMVTHGHVEGREGAVAVAAAAAIAAQSSPPEGEDFLLATLPFVPESLTRRGIVESLEIPGDPGIRGPVQRIEAVASVAGSHDLVAVTRGGDLLVCKSEKDWVCQRLPEPGSPRSLAAHPVEPWIAVGIKQRGFEDPRGAVAILAIE